MTPDKERRLATAVGFISGVFACLDALRGNLYWPPNVAWDALRRPQQLEFGGGVALMLVTVILSIVRRHET